MSSGPLWKKSDRRDLYDPDGESLRDIVRSDDRLFTPDVHAKGSVYGERIIDVQGSSYREWVPWRSKLGALLKKTDLPFDLEGEILYLGAAQGTTVSHISDVLEKGTIFAVEFSRAAFNKLVKLTAQRNNIVPIMADAFHPERYRAQVPNVGILYQDVSQKDQLGLFMKNSELFLRKGGKGILMVKARSIDVTARPEDIFKDLAGSLNDQGCEVLDTIDLEPFQKDHCAILIKQK